MTEFAEPAVELVMLRSSVGLDRENESMCLPNMGALI